MTEKSKRVVLDGNYITRAEAIQIAKDILNEAEKAREESAIHADVGDEYCRVCGGRDHQCDENVVERSVKKDKEIHSDIELLTKALEAEKAKNAELVEFNNKASAEIERLEKNNQKLNTEIDQLVNECRQHQADCAKYSTEWARALNDLAKENKEIEQLRVQLAGCGVAALGGTDPDKCQVAKKGDYGWSPAYQDTLELRKAYESSVNTRNLKLACIESVASYDRELAKINQDDKRWSPAYERVWEMRSKVCEDAGTIGRQQKHLEIKDEEIKLLKEKLKNKDDTISILVDQVKKAKGRFLDVVARDDGKEIEALKARCAAINNEWRELYDAEKKGWLESRDKRDKEIERLEKELSRQQKAATDLFDECKRLQEERTQFLKDYGAVVEECGKLRSTKLSGAPTWPQYKQQRGPEMEPEEIGNMMAGAELAAKEEDKVEIGGDQLSQENIERLLSEEEIGGEQLDPGKAIQDVHEPPNCAICGSEAEATCVRDKKGGYSVLRVRCSNPECAESGHQHTPGNWNDEAGGSLCPECGSRPSTQTDVEWEEKVIRRSCSNKSCVNHRPWLDAASWNRLQKKEGGV